MRTRLWGIMSYKIHFFFKFPLEHLPLEPGRSERRKWGKVPPEHFHHGEKVRREVVTQRGSSVRSEPY
jgi:hypothetical protein